MIEKQLTILNKYGLHVRPSTSFSQTAQGFDSQITVTVPDGRRADGKSLLELLSLGIHGGTEISLTIDGDDEAEAMAAICQLVQNQFGLRYDE